MAKIAVVGSRSIENSDWVNYHLDKLVLEPLTKDFRPVTIISGGAKGVDTLAMEYAEANGMDFVLYKPYHLIDNKEEYKPRFFFTRNKQIVDNADEVVVFWDGVSNGAKDVIRYATKRKKPLTVIEYDEEEAKKLA